jgi:hypothetical protein
MFIALSATTVAAEALITLIFAILPIVLGLLALRISIRNQGKIGVRQRVYLIIIGVVALFLWAGIFIGPILAIITALMPTKTRENRKTNLIVALQKHVRFHLQPEAVEQLLRLGLQSLQQRELSFLFCQKY